MLYQAYSISQMLICVSSQQLFEVDSIILILQTGELRTRGITNFWEVMSQNLAEPGLKMRAGGSEPKVFSVLLIHG
jgi:hypothetical protein